MWSRLQRQGRSLILGGATGVIMALTATPATAQTAEIATINVVGNQTTEASLILSRFELAVGDRYNPALVRKGVKDLYALGLFEDITPRVEQRSDGRVNLVIEVKERPRIAGISFRGNDHLDADELMENIVLAKGQLYDPAAVEAARREILISYREEGFPLTDVIIATQPFEQTGQVTVTFVVEEGERVRLRKIAFVGNSQVAEGDLRGVMDTKPKGFLRKGRFEQEKFEEDLQRVTAYYHDHGYRDARVLDYNVSYSRDQRDMFIDVEVDEGPLYRMETPTWHGNEAIPDEVISRFIPWDDGDPYSYSKIQAMTAAISEVFTEHGYLVGFNVQDQETVQDDHRVAVHYRIFEGEPSKVGEVKISGNTRTKERVIRRELSIYPGETFRRSTLMRSQREIFALGYFDNVIPQFHPRQDGTNDIDIEFQVEERRLGTAGAGLGFSSATGLTGFIQIGHTNLFGNGWKLNMHLERGARRSRYELGFTEPWLFDRPISAGFQIFDSEFSRDLYDEKTRGFSFTLGWPVPNVDFTRASTTFRIQDVNIPFVDPTLSPESILALRASEGSQVSVLMSVSRNTTDNPFYPTAGSKTIWTSNLTGGLLGGVVHYQKHRLDHRMYVRPFWKPTLMFRGRFGYLTELGNRRGLSVPANETFRLGGVLFDYLRGYDDYEVVPDENVEISQDGRVINRFPGGRAMATFTVEYQFPIAHPLHGLMFMDLGDTWNTVDDISLNNFKRGAGVGLRMEVPMLGMIGLDYAYGFDRLTGARWKPHLIFGRVF